jgi:cytidine deaminase
VTHGAREFVAIAVVTGAAHPSSPCGACRQILYEFAGDASLVTATTGGESLRTTVRALLPFGFDASSLAGTE